MNFALQSLSRSLTYWQSVYLVSIVVALLGSATMAVLAFRGKTLPAASKLSSIVTLLASLLATTAGFLIVSKTRNLDSERDRALREAMDASSSSLAQAKKDAEKAFADAANAKATVEKAKREAEATRKANLQLQAEISLREHQQDGLATQLADRHPVERQTSKVTRQDLAQTPAIDPPNGIPVETLAQSLKEFSGQHVSVHGTPDKPSTRLAAQFHHVLEQAGIKTEGSKTDPELSYEDVTIRVKNPLDRPHPAVADGLISALRAAGLKPQLVWDPFLSGDDEVRLCVGPR